MDEEDKAMLSIEWEVEQLDNGITIQDKASLQKEAAIYNDTECQGLENIQRLLGKWLYAELYNFQKQSRTSQTHITIQFEDVL